MTLAIELSDGNLNRSGGYHRKLVKIDTLNGNVIVLISPMFYDTLSF